MIRNRTKNTILASSERSAERWFARLRGLIGHDFCSFDGMVFPDCSAIHTFFMGMKIDVLFLDGNGTVMRACPAVPPWKPCLTEKRSCITVELPEGTIARTQTAAGDSIRLENPENGAILPWNMRK